VEPKPTDDGDKDKDEESRERNDLHNAVPSLLQSGTTATVPGSPSTDKPLQSELDNNTVKVDPQLARRCLDLYQLTNQIIGKCGITMTAELVARVAIMVSLSYPFPSVHVS
jgi:hypothetical protein